jgi:conjugative relaxase-like TrwC/TraI family protein
MTIAKITAGEGYTYLIQQVAQMTPGLEQGGSEQDQSLDAAGYYMAQGNPPGRWIGRGAPLLGIDGQQVTETQMKSLFGLGRHPDAEAMLDAYLEAHGHGKPTEAERRDLLDAAIRHVSLGRSFPAYEPLDPFEDRVSRRLAAITKRTGTEPTPAEVRRVAREEAHAGRAAAAGWDLVFTPVKSASLLWALDERPWVRDAVQAAHREAIGSALQFLEQHAAFTRKGAGGVAQIETGGLIAAAFDHWDSRAGDPQLHTHVAVSAKVQGIDGKWRALDATALHQVVVAASELYNTGFEAGLIRRTGVSFTPRPGTVRGREPVREITGIPHEYIQFYSARRAQIEGRYAELAAGYRAEHGRDPSGKAAYKLAQQATLETRDGKKPPSSLTAKRAEWRAQLQAAFGPAAIQTVMASVPGPQPARVGPSAQLRPVLEIAELARQVIANVSLRRSTWTIWHVRAETERAARQVTTFADPAAHREFTEKITAEALSPRCSIRLDPPAALDEPAALRRSSGEAVFTRHGSDTFTSRAVLDAEARLITAAKTLTAAAVTGPAVTAAIAEFEKLTGTRLDTGQRALVTHFAASGMLLAAGIGPAGTGKTTAMRAYAHVLASAGHRIIPLAPSAAAAKILAASLGVPADTVDKFVHEHYRSPYAAALQVGRPVPATRAIFALRPGDVVLIDEGGMAPGLKVDQVVAAATHHGAVVRTLGDHGQLGAVQGSGVLRLIATEAGAAELTTVYRFANPAEAAATLAIRAGDASALGFYFGAGRVRAGSRQAMTEAAYHGWKTDMLAGKTTLMAAAANADVTALAARARADRVTAGQVEPGGVTLHDGNNAGAGDWILTRRNDRSMRMHRGRDWVKNGDGWTVTTRHRDGALTVTHLGHGGQVRLPAGYVREHVALLYASTAHRAEGSTVDTAHPLITRQMAREDLYAIISRARHGTTLYVTTHEQLPLDPDPHIDQGRHDPALFEAREILERITARQGRALTATEQIRDLQAHVGSLADLVPRYLYAIDEASSARHQAAARFALGPDLAETVIRDQGWTGLRRVLQRAEASGWQTEQLLAAAARSSNLDGADSAARQLTDRATAITSTQVARPHLHRPEPGDAARYAQLLATIPALAGQAPDPAAAQQVPDAISISQRRPPAAGDHPSAPDKESRQTNLTAVLGAAMADRARSETAWPALTAVLDRAAQAGHDLREVLAAAQTPGIRAAVSISEFLAWQINRQLAEQPAPPAQPTAHDAWPQLAWTLKAAEQRGVPAEDILAAVSAATLPELLRHAERSAPRPPAAGPEPLPWLPPVPPLYDDPARADYVHAANSLIAGRARELGAFAARERPAWTALLGLEPLQAGSAERWQRDLALIAAYRDQQQTQTDDSLQVLGPYAGPGRGGDVAYWQAAQAVFSARREAGLEPPIADGPAARAVRQVAADVYSCLPRPEQDAIAAQIAADVGPFWYGDSDRPSPETAAQPPYDQHLTEALTARGHLTATIQQPDSAIGLSAGPSPVEADRVRGRQAVPQRAPELLPPPPEPPAHQPVILP